MTSSCKCSIAKANCKPGRVELGNRVANVKYHIPRGTKEMEEHEKALCTRNLCHLVHCAILDMKSKQG